MKRYIIRILSPYYVPYIIYFLIYQITDPVFCHSMVVWEFLENSRHEREEAAGAIKSTPIWVLLSLV